MLKPVRTVPPASTILDLSALKSHLRIDHADEDWQLSDILEAVDAHFDGWAGVLGRCIAAQTWIYRTAALADTRLPFPDVQSAVVRYLDEAGAEQTLAASNYRLLNDELGGFLQIVEGVTLPTVAERDDAVRIEAVYGFAAVPSAIRMAAMLYAGHLYRQREGAGEPPMAVDALIAPYRHRAI